MQYQARITAKGVKANPKCGLIRGMAYGNTAITPRTIIASLLQVKAQYDQSAGRPGGKRTHSPLVITKQTDSASPQLLTAHWSNEVLSSLVLEIVGRPSTGKGEVVVGRISLTNASVVGYTRYHPALAGSNLETQHDTTELEEVKFIFQKIEVTNLAGSTSASDDWNSSNK